MRATPTTPTAAERSTARQMGPPTTTRRRARSSSAPRTQEEQQQQQQQQQQRRPLRKSGVGVKRSTLESFLRDGPLNGNLLEGLQELRYQVLSSRVDADADGMVWIHSFLARGRRRTDNE